MREALAFPIRNLTHGSVFMMKTPLAAISPSYSQCSQLGLIVCLYATIWVLRSTIHDDNCALAGTKGREALAPLPAARKAGSVPKTLDEKQLAGRLHV